MATATPLSMDEAHGSYVWEVADSTQVSDFLTATNGTLLKSKPFSIGKLMWLLEAFPNGDREDNVGSFMIYLTLVQLPPQWQRVTFLLRLFNQETCSSFTGVVTYSVSANSGGWSDGTMRLTDLAECMQSSSMNKISLGCQITILALMGAGGDKAHYQYPLRPEYIHMLKAPNPVLHLQWLVDAPLLQKFKHANNGKKFESDIFYDCWSLRCAPKGKRQEDADNVKLYLLLCALPPNIVHCKVRYTLSCEEASREWTNTRCFSYTYPNVGWPDGTMMTAELSAPDGQLQHLTQLTFKAKLEILKLYDTDELSVDESSSSDDDDDDDGDDAEDEDHPSQVVKPNSSSSEDEDTIDSDESSSFEPDATGDAAAAFLLAHDQNGHGGGHGGGHDPQHSLNVTMNVSGYFSAQHQAVNGGGGGKRVKHDADADADDDDDAKEENDALGALDATDQEVFSRMAKKKRSVSFAKDADRKHRRQQSVAKRSEIKRRQSREALSYTSTTTSYAIATSYATALPPILSPSVRPTMHHQFHDRNETDQLPLTTSQLQKSESSHVDSPLPNATFTHMVLSSSNHSNRNGVLPPRPPKYQQSIPYVQSYSHENETGAVEVHAGHSRGSTMIEHEHVHEHVHDEDDTQDHNMDASQYEQQQRLSALEKQNADMSQQLNDITQMLKSLTTHVQNLRDGRVPGSNASGSNTSTQFLHPAHMAVPHHRAVPPVDVNELRNVLYSVRNDLSLLKNKFASNETQNAKDNKIKEWLTYKVQLPQYFDLFIENGLDDMDDIKDLTDAELMHIGVTKIGHRKKMLRAMQFIQTEQQRKFQVYVD